MKFTFPLSAFAIISSLSANPALADKRETIHAAKSGATIITTSAIGAALGGPAGLAIGGAIGALLSEREESYMNKNIALEQSTQSINALNIQLDNQALEIEQLEKMIDEKMQFQLYFDTGKDELTEGDTLQLEALADFLKENDYMHVTIDGHTDPRGTEEYNSVLSDERANTVASILTSEGIDARRINTQGHGAHFSKGFSDDPNTYAQERKVKVQVFSSKSSSNLASLD